jgi:hypothetical protein
MFRFCTRKARPPKIRRFCRANWHVRTRYKLKKECFVPEIFPYYVGDIVQTTHIVNMSHLHTRSLIIDFCRSQV